MIGGRVARAGNGFRPSWSTSLTIASDLASSLSNSWRNTSRSLFSSRPGQRLAMASRQSLDRHWSTAGWLRRNASSFRLNGDRRGRRLAGTVSRIHASRMSCRRVPRPRKRLVSGHLASPSAIHCRTRSTAGRLLLRDLLACRQMGRSEETCDPRPWHKRNALCATFGHAGTGFRRK